MKKTTIGIIGAGPSGLTLALMLQKSGIASVILENRSKEYVENRVRAGLLEHNTVATLENLGVAERLHKEGLVHHGCFISFDGEMQRIDFKEHTNKEVAIYGQQEIVKDLIKACAERNIEIVFEAEVIEIKDVETSNPSLVFFQNEEQKALNCDFVAACDGFHGIGRKTLPEATYNKFEIEYPFSWLGILAYSKPTYEELIYANHQNGFALASMRSEKVSRLYLQVSNDEKIENWTDTAIWNELENRLGIGLNKGEIFEKGITPMRSFMIDNMQFGRLFLAGDAAHIVPPTGAKGLNLAIADIHLLAKALIDFYENKNEDLLENYTQNCLKRIWRVQEFSNFMTNLCHKVAEPNSFESKLQRSKFDFLQISKAYQKTIAENYVGLPYDVFV
jgi:p-hydroxybenzoate 3-monooxygenase